MKDRDRHADARDAKRRRRARMVVGSKSVFVIKAALDKRTAAAVATGGSK